MHNIFKNINNVTQIYYYVLLVFICLFQEKQWTNGRNVSGRFQVYILYGIRSSHVGSFHWFGVLFACCLFLVQRIFWQSDEETYRFCWWSIVVPSNDFLSLSNGNGIKNFEIHNKALKFPNAMFGNIAYISPNVDG